MAEFGGETCQLFCQCLGEKVRVCTVCVCLSVFANLCVSVCPMNTCVYVGMRERELEFAGSKPCLCIAVCVAGHISQCG